MYGGDWSTRSTKEVAPVGETILLADGGVSSEELPERCIARFCNHSMFRYGHRPWDWSSV